MSDNEATTEQDQPAFPKAARLINPTIRGYMEALSLQRFFGGYVINPVPESVYNLGIGEVGNMPLDKEPFEIYRDFVQHGELAGLALRYSGTMGERETNALQAAWLNLLLDTQGLAGDLVVSMDGGQNAISTAVRAFTSPLGTGEDRKHYVLLAAPSYPYFSAVVAAQAGLQAFLAYDGEQFARGVETWCNAAVGLILVNVPHNPMGFGLTGDQVARINRVAQHYDCVILVDLVYACYPDDPGVGEALGGFDPERTVFVDSFSKRYGYPGLRLGFAASAAEPLTHALRFVKMSESLTPSNVKLAFAGHLMANYPDYPGKLAREVRRRNRAFVAAFAPPRAAGVKPFTGRPNPFYLALDVSRLAAKTGMSDAEITRYCQEVHNVRVFPGSFVYPNASLDHATFSQGGRLSPSGDPPYLAPSFPQGAQIVYAPDFFDARIPLLRLSFGVETRMEESAAALAKALGTLAQGDSGAQGARGEP
ncbi:MAG: pyridoxal phosphate-dependent aminotransferase, partial [bacterium]